MVLPNQRRQIDSNKFIAVTINISASKKDRGVFNNRVECHFEIPSLNRRFAITRPLIVRIGSGADYEALKAKNTYFVRKPARRGPITRYIAGIRPQALAEIKWARKLEMYDMTNDLQAILSQEELKPTEKLTIIRATLLPGAFGPNTYGQYMHQMLWIEEERARLVRVTDQIERC